MADVLGFFKKALPYLSVGLSLAGPPGNAAAAILGKVFNQNNPTTKSVTDALSSLTLTPEVQAQLRESELQYQQLMTAAGYQNAEEMAQIGEADRASARAMQVANKSWLPPLLSIVVVVMCLGLECWFAHAIFAGQKFNSDGAVIIGRILGTLDGAFVLVLGYWFGSSSGSDRKTELMANGNGH